MLVPVAATGDLVGLVSASAHRVLVSHSEEVPDTRAAMRMMLRSVGTGNSKRQIQGHQPGDPAAVTRGGVVAHTKMLEAYPKDLGHIDKEKLAECIAACFECAQVCTACADACLSEDMVAELTKCIRTNLDCADICVAAGNALSRHTGYDANVTRAFLEACATACKACGDECESHADMHEHCRICAEACRRCEQACRDLLANLG